MKRAVRVLLLLIVLVYSTPTVTAQLGITFSTDTLRLGDVRPCLGARDSFYLVNTGTRDVPSPGVSFIPGFRVEAENDNNILVGESRKIFVTFIGNSVVQSYTSRYLLNVSIQGESSSDTIWILARRLSGRCCVFRVDTIRGFAGDDVAIRIMQDSTQVGTYLSDVVSTMHIGFDSTTVVPVGSRPQMIDETNGSFTIRVNLLNENGVLATVPARMALGNAIRSEARIVWHSNSDIRLIDTTYAGPVELLGVCLDKGNRLFNPNARSANVWALAGFINVESRSESNDPVYVYDVQGRVIDFTDAAPGIIVTIPCIRGAYFVKVGDQRARLVLVP
ncbi:MAG: hypothetical protein NTX15_02970 [Candidatus Kapabacteria bacterium]|nr:hypothetical protein [Candidatus Kapabacteria bacterium]